MAKGKKSDQTVTKDVNKAAKAPNAEVNKAANGNRVGIGGRKADWFYIISYILFANVFFLVFLTRCNQVLPEELNGVQLREPICSLASDLESHLSFFLEAHHTWNEKIFAAENHFSLVLVNQVNVVFSAPLAYVLAFGFWRGQQWTKNLGLIHAAVSFYNMMATDMVVHNIVTSPEFESVEHAKEVAFIVYGFFTLFFLTVIYRLRTPFPFSAATIYAKKGALTRFLSFFVKFALFMWFICTFVAFYEFSITHTSLKMQGLPSAVDAAMEYQDVAAELQVLATEYCSTGGEKALEYGSYGAVEASKLAEQVGNQLLDFAASLTAEAPKK